MHESSRSEAITSLYSVSWLRVGPVLGAAVLALTPSSAHAGVQPYVNLMDYGAIDHLGPGAAAANDTAFERAMDALCAPDAPRSRKSDIPCGGIVWVPPGEYLVDKPVEITKDIQIQGAGPSTRIRWAGPNDAASNGGVQPIVFDFLGTNGFQQMHVGISDMAMITDRFFTIPGGETYPRGDPDSLVVAVSFGRMISGTETDDAGYHFPASIATTEAVFVREMDITDFGIGVLLGQAGPANPHGSAIYASTVERNTLRYCNVGIYTSANADNADTFTDNGIFSGNVGIWLRGGDDDTLRGGAIQGCEGAGILMNSGGQTLIESIHFEADGSQHFAQGCPGADGTPEGASITINVKALGMNNVVLRDALIGRIDVCSSYGGGRCPFAGLEVDQVSGGPVRVSPECQAYLGLGGLKITDSPLPLEKLPWPDGGTPPMITFNANGFDPFSHWIEAGPPDAPSAFRVYDNGDVTMGWSAGVTTPPTAKLTIYGAETFSGPYHPSPVFHAIDIVGEARPAAGDLDEIRFGQQSWIQRFGDDGAGGSIAVVDTAAPGSPLGPAGSDMVFSTNGAPAGANHERVRITSIGYVGIGTASPSRTLDVNGAVRVSDDAAFGAGIIVKGDASVGGRLVVSSCDGCARIPVERQENRRTVSLDDALGRLANVQIVQEVGDNSQRGRIGISPGSLERTFPELVAKRGAEKEVDFVQLSAVLWEALKEEEAARQRDDRELSALKAQVGELAAAVKSLSAGRAGMRRDPATP